MDKRVFGAIGLAIVIQAAAIAQEAPMTPLRPDQIAFLALYKELVETNTTLSAGSCTMAAKRISAHLKAAGYVDEDITLFSVPDRPKEGGLVAILAGTSKTAKPMLLLGHLDVVEAKRDDRRSRRQGHLGPPGPSCSPAAPARSQNRRSGRRSGREILPRRTVDSFHVDRSHRRDFSGGDRHSGLRRTRRMD
jgi:hypothetical protein